MRNFLLIDMNNLIHRARHSSTGDIETIAALALHIALSSMRQSWRKFHIDHIVVCLEGRSWRKSIYPGYKAHRVAAQQVLSKKEKEDNEFFYNVFNLFIDFLKQKTNATVLQCEIAEADDLIARWIHLHPDDNHIILSSDHDFYQLLAGNVKIYDGIKGWTISPTEVLDEKDKPAKIKKNIKIKDPSGKTKTKGETFLVEAPDPEYSLFFKIIRGDSSDNVMSAYPGVRENGSAKKPGIKEAYADRFAKGFDWNNFMLQEWEKLDMITEDGTTITKKVRVIDEFKINELLVDLTKQPNDVKEIIDASIQDQINIEKKPNIGFNFLRFVTNMNLNNIAKSPEEFAKMLNQPYENA